MVMATETERETEPIPSVKDLASSDPAARRKNLQAILSHLETRSPSHYLTRTQALQLWRGFHVSLYMHDSKNQLSVQTLIATLASTFKVIQRKDVELRSKSTDSNALNEASSKAAATSKGTPKQVQSIAKDNDEDEFTGFDDEDDGDEPTPTTMQISSSWLSTYASAFWETMAREWSGVDQWRMNKYLLLIRFALREILGISLSAYFGLEASLDEENSVTPSSKKRKANDEEPEKSTSKKGAKKSKKNTGGNSTDETPPPPKSSLQAKYQNPDPSTTNSQLSILALGPLSPRERKVSDGLRLHMLDIYLDELFTALKSALAAAHDRETSQDAVKKVLEEVYLEPIRAVAKDGLAKHVRVKAKEVLSEFARRIAEVEI